MAVLLALCTLYFCSFHLSVAAMETLAPLIYISSTVMAVYQKRFVWPAKSLLVAFSGLLITAVVSFLWNGLPLKDLLDYLGEFRWILSFIGFVQFFNLSFERIKFQNLVFAAQIVLIIAGFYSIYQFFTAHDPFRKSVVFHYIYFGSPYWRPNSFFGLPTTYAYASAMFFCVSLAFWMREKRPTGWKRVTTQFYFIMSAFNIFLTFTRAAWLAFIGCSLGVLFLINKKFCIRVALVFVLFVTAMYTSMPSFRNRVNSIYDPAYVANHNRIYLWKANMMIFAESPLIGIGFDENRKVIDTYLNRLNQPEVMRNHPHNTYINFLAGLGVIGFGFFMMFIILNLKHTIEGLKNTSVPLHKTLYIGALGLQGVLLLGGLTECTFEDIELTHQFIFYTALVQYLRLRDSSEIQGELARPART